MFYFIFFFGVLWAIIMLYIVIMGLRSKSWPLTTGKIITSEVRREVSQGRSRTVSYKPYVLYEYYVGGNCMQSEQIAFGGRLQTYEKKAQNIIKNYPAGKNIPVYYNPQSQSQAVLITGNIAGAYIALAAGFIFIALGIIGIISKW